MEFDHIPELLNLLSFPKVLSSYPPNFRCKVNEAGLSNHFNIACSYYGGKTIYKELKFYMHMKFPHIHVS